VKFKVKLPFQVHIEEKPDLVPTDVSKLRGYEVNNNYNKSGI